MGLSNSKRASKAAPPIRRDKVRGALKLGMTWLSGDPDGDDFDQHRDKYYRSLNGCTKEEVDYVEDALRHHGF